MCSNCTIYNNVKMDQRAAMHQNTTHKEAKTSARILTSEESRKLLEEKERKKQEALAKKVENQRKRQEKQQEKGTVPATGNHVSK